MCMGINQILLLHCCYLMDSKEKYSNWNHKTKKIFTNNNANTLCKHCSKSISMHYKSSSSANPPHWRLDPKIHILQRGRSLPIGKSFSIWPNTSFRILWYAVSLHIACSYSAMQVCLHCYPDATTQCTFLLPGIRMNLQQINMFRVGTAFLWATHTAWRQLVSLKREPESFLALLQNNRE